MKILAADDNDDARVMLKKILEADGHTVRLAGNGGEALKAARESAPDLIISDILMPEMDGFRLCHEVRSDPVLKETPFIFYTATYTDESDELLALSLGADRFIRKPEDQDTFLKKIRALTRGALEGRREPADRLPVGIEEQFNLYSERLVAKLEKKMLDLEREIAERQRAEENYRALVESSCDHIFMISPEGVYMASNGRVAQFGLNSGEEIVGRHLRDFYPAETADTYLKKVHEVVARGEVLSFEHTLQDSDGFHYHLDTLYPIFHQGVVRTVGGSCRDITARKRGETALKESEEKYRLLVDSAIDAIFIAQDGVIKFPNPAVMRVLGYSVEEMDQAPFARFIHPEDAESVFDRHVRRLKGEEVPSGYTFRVLSKAGKTIWVQINATRIAWEGRPATLNFLRDITRERDLQKQVETAQRMEAVGTLAGGIAHDFNNALTVVIGFGEMLKTRFANDPKALSDLDEVLRAADRAAVLTRQLLAFARRQVIDPSNLDLNEVMAGFGKLLRKVVREDIEIKISPAKGLPTIRADQGQVEQILMNFSLNARDAMPGGGRLVVGTEEASVDEEYVKRYPYMKAGRYAVLSVSDTGMGMDEETRAHIFEPFFTTKEPEKGTGLGLAVVYGIVKQHNGFIHVYSEPGRGTTFRVYFPAVDVSPDSKVGVIQGNIRGGRETILLAEDNESVRSLTEKTLSSHGYTVLVACDGEEAVDLFRRHGEEIAMVVLDVVMPKKGGQQVYDEMISTKPGLKVLFLSGYSANAIHDSFVLHPGIPFLQKPFGPGALARKVREVLDGK